MGTFPNLSNHPINLKILIRETCPNLNLSLIRTFFFLHEVRIRKSLKRSRISPTQPRWGSTALSFSWQPFLDDDEKNQHLHQNSFSTEKISIPTVMIAPIKCQILANPNFSISMHCCSQFWKFYFAIPEYVALFRSSSIPIFHNSDVRYSENSIIFIL